MTKKQLGRLVWERRLVPKYWMRCFLEKGEAALLLERNQPLPEAYIQILTDRKDKKVAQVRQSTYNRKERFGITEPTTREVVTRFVESTPGLQFVEFKRLDEFFVSVAGHRRVYSAYVFTDDNGEVHLLARGEAEIARELGIDVPIDVILSPPPVHQRNKLQSWADLIDDAD